MDMVEALYYFFTKNPLALVLRPDMCRFPRGPRCGAGNRTYTAASVKNCAARRRVTQRRAAPGPPITLQEAYESFLRPNTGWLWTRAAGLAPVVFSAAMRHTYAKRNRLAWPLGAMAGRDSAKEPTSIAVLWTLRVRSSRRCLHMSV